MKKICFVTHSTPEYLGGVSLFHKNFIDYCKNKKIKNIEITWIYFGEEDRKFSKEGINYIELKKSKTGPLHNFLENIKLIKLFKDNYFDIINYAGGFWTFFYKKKKNQRIIHTFHGTVYYFNKNHLQRINIFLKPLFYLYLGLAYLVERPHKKADKIICVSEKVKEQVTKLYGSNIKKIVIRTGVSLDNFKPRDREKTRKSLGLEKKNNYALYVGRGGYWTKGLDRAIKLSKELYNLDKSYRLIVIGPDEEKCKEFLKEEFVLFKKNVPREKMPLYYSSADYFFCFSRYEGVAPTLVTSEALASGCLLICSKDSRQEIIKDGINGLILEKFNLEEAKKIYEIKNNAFLLERIRKKAIKDIRELSLEKWGKRYLSELIN